MLEHDDETAKAEISFYIFINIINVRSLMLLYFLLLHSCYFVI